MTLVKIEAPELYPGIILGDHEISLKRADSRFSVLDTLRSGYREIYRARRAVPPMTGDEKLRVAVGTTLTYSTKRSYEAFENLSPR